MPAEDLPAQGIEAEILFLRSEAAQKKIEAESPVPSLAHARDGDAPLLNPISWGYFNFCFFFCLFLALLGTPFLGAQSSQGGTSGESFIPGGHRGEVNILLHDGEGLLLSAGADGFLEIWDIPGEKALRRFQVSSLPLKSMALRPGEKELCLIEADGMGINRISAWDYERLERLFSLDFEDPLSYVTYSAGGTYLMAAAGGSVFFSHAQDRGAGEGYG